MFYTIIGIIVIILDQAVKLLVTNTITGDAPIKELIPGVLSLVSVRNDGAAFSFLAGGGARIWFIILTGIFTLLVIIALATNFISGKFGRWCMVLVVAGGLSNCLDRILYGYVLDMFKIELFDFAVFNVADIFITVGCIAFILYILFGGEKEPEPDADEYDEYDEEEEDRPRFENIKASLKKDKSAPKAKSSKVQMPSKARAKTRPEPVIENKPAPSTRRPVVDRRNDDPFAEWDKFTKKDSEPARPVVSQPRQASVQQRPAAPAYVRETQPTGRPAASYAPPVKQSPKPAPVKYEPEGSDTPSFDELDLDAILNEFK